MVVSNLGKEAVAAVLGADEFFGQGCLIGRPIRLAKGRAMVASRRISARKAGRSSLLNVTADSRPQLADLLEN